MADYILGILRPCAALATMSRGTYLLENLELKLLETWFLPSF